VVGASFVRGRLIIWKDRIGKKGEKEMGQIERQCVTAGIPEEEP